ncbi:hypothetical protein G6F52_014126 [Rhizopus delemar]|nr:hypothetical protein G6F52_014126 [Rhizopus delemar]
MSATIWSGVAVPGACSVPQAPVGAAIGATLEALNRPVKPFEASPSSATRSTISSDARRAAAASSLGRLMPSSCARPISSKP